MEIIVIKQKKKKQNTEENTASLHKKTTHLGGLLWEIKQAYLNTMIQEFLLTSYLQKHVC